MHKYVLLYSLLFTRFPSKLAAIIRTTVDGLHTKIVNDVTRYRGQTRGVQPER